MDSMETDIDTTSSHNHLTYFECSAYESISSAHKASSEMSVVNLEATKVTCDARNVNYIIQ
jgi:hypothetical protein